MKGTNTVIKKDLVLGIGNVDRQDDGVAWHILSNLNRRLERPSPPTPDDEFEITGQSPDLRFVLQLTPDLSEDLSSYRRLCFVDAHTDQVNKDIQIVKVDSRFQSSPFTHHLTPASILAFTDSIYHRAPEAALVSVRGYQFGFSRSLSTLTAQLAEQAADLIWKWLWEYTSDDLTSIP
ncbi:MAG: hypothetical protein ACM3PY_07440 [Omnitrophica WOR_2 bacterium]